MSVLTKAQTKALRYLGRQPIGYHFAETATERALFGALVRAGLARKAWNFGSWSFILTDAGLSTLAGLGAAK